MVSDLFQLKLKAVTKNAFDLIRFYPPLSVVKMF
jgi:hypothetical protein